MGEITLELHLVFQIPESGLTINGLIGGLKQAVGQIDGAILESLMKALEERLIDAMVQSDPERYRRNGSQSKARYLKSSLEAIPYRFAQLRDEHSGRSLTPLVKALAIPAYGFARKGSSPLFAFCQCFFNPSNSSVKLFLFRYSLLHQQIGRAHR